MRWLLVMVFFLSGLAIGYAQPASSEVRNILRRSHAELGIRDDEIDQYSVRNKYHSTGLGIDHVYLQQSFREIPVYNGILNLNIKDGNLVSSGNSSISRIAVRAPSDMPGITALNALENACVNVSIPFVVPDEIGRTNNTSGNPVSVTFSPAGMSRNDILCNLMWIELPDSEVRLAWNIELYQAGAKYWWNIFIDAHSGEFIRRDNLIKECAFEPATHAVSGRKWNSNTHANSTALPVGNSYNVFHTPVETPNHGDRTVVVNPWDSAGISNPATTLGWHNDGDTNYIITRGNNVFAYEDADGNDLPGYSPESVTLEFDFDLDLLLDPADNQDAAVTNLFFWNNLIHDVMYQYGFDEPAGNFQNDNLGRGGEGQDYVLAEAQDGSGLNNAYFSTPVDGNHGRMEMFLWSAVQGSSPFMVDSPMTIAGEYYALESDFSSNNKLVDVGTTSGQLVLVNDEGSDTHEACGDLSNVDSLIGRIAVIDRGNCDFVIKVKTAQDAGAIGAVVINNVPGGPIVMGGTDNTITIPAVMIGMVDGDTIKATLGTDSVSVTLDTVPEVTPDGDFDNGIITHEYGHGVSIRLTGGPGTSSCLNNDEQMGEGWSDYFGLMFTTDWLNASAEDIRGIGTYVLGEPTDGTGIRTYPYSTDTSVNSFTYADIADAPVFSGNVSPHFVGSVWATMLWDMTWNIIAEEGVDPDIYHGTGGNNIALQLVIDGLKLQPCSPGFVDGRDAILLADQIRYNGAHQCAIWEAFAQRGLGFGADQGSSNDHQDGVESYAIPGGITIKSSPALAEVLEGAEVEITLQAICQCTDKSNIIINELISPDLHYVHGSGGIFSGDTVRFVIDTLNAQDTASLSYRGIVAPCSAIIPYLLSEEDAELPDGYTSIKLAGNGPKKWDKSGTISVSPSNSWYAQNYSNVSDIALTLNDPIETTGPIRIEFYHRYSTEAAYDGGVVEYSIDNGSTWLDAGEHFLEYGYPAMLNNVGPLAGRPAFTGNSDIQFDTSTFVKSIIELCIQDTAQFKLRFRFASDAFAGGSGINGWYVDDIVIIQQSGVVNKTLVQTDPILLDSNTYCIPTRPFEHSAIYVDSTATGNHTGLSWDSAYRDLATALTLAFCRTNIDTIFLARGTFTPDTSGDRSVSFEFPDSVLIFGGFPSGGGAIENRSPELYPTILSGDIGIPADTSDNSYHVVRINPGQKAIILDGVSIREGRASGSADDRFGSAILSEGEFTILNSVISGNSGLESGSVISSRTAEAHTILINCTLITLPDGTIKIHNSDFSTLGIEGTNILYSE